jgi:predicted kinase
LYATSWTDRTYTVLIDRARELLATGESVIIDASWAHPRWRTAAEELADTTSSDLVALRCEAPVTVSSARAVARVAEGTDASDVGPELVHELTERFAPWPRALVVDTSRAPSAVVNDALATLAAPRCAITHAHARQP